MLSHNLDPKILDPWRTPNGGRQRGVSRRILCSCCTLFRMDETEADIDAQIDALKAKKQGKSIESFASLVEENKCTTFKGINAVCRELQGRIPKKGLRLTKGYNGNRWRTSISCLDHDCPFVIVCTRSKSLNSVFKVNKEKTILVHGGKDEAGEPFTCNSVYKAPAKEVVNNPAFLALSAQAQGSVKRNRATSICAIKAVIAASAGSGEPTTNAIKRANAAIKFSSKEHLESYGYLKPYCEVAKRLNADFMYSIEKNEKDIFQRMAVLFPYSKTVLENSYEVLGVDAAHMKTELLKKLTTDEMVKLDLGDIDGSHGVMLKKSMLTFLTGRTLNNEMIVYGYMLGYSENSDNLRYFFQFLIDSGLNLDRETMTIMSDRALAYTGPIQEKFPKALHHLCPLHIKRNLADHIKGISPGLVSQYWKVQQSKTLEDYCEAMDVLEAMENGAKAKKYLCDIEGVWQLYRVIDRGNVIFCQFHCDKWIEAVKACK